MGISLHTLQQDAYANVMRAIPTKKQMIEMCRIEDVDTKSKLVTAYFFDTDTIANNVPYCLPYYSLGTGIIFAPAKGSLGIATWDSIGKPLILAFTSPLGFDNTGADTRHLENLRHHNLPELLEGEVLVSSSGRSFVRFDKLGGLMLSNAFFAYLSIDENGVLDINVESAVATINGTAREEYLINYEQSVTIIKGIHESQGSHRGNNGLLLCYEITIGGEIVFGVTPDGKLIRKEETTHAERVQRSKRKRAYPKGSTRRFRRS